MSENLEKKVILKDSKSGVQLYPKTKANLVGIDYYDPQSGTYWFEAPLSDILPYDAYSENKLITVEGTDDFLKTKGLYSNRHCGNFSKVDGSVNHGNFSYIQAKGFTGTPGLEFNWHGNVSVCGFTPITIDSSYVYAQKLEIPKFIWVNLWQDGSLDSHSYYKIVDAIADEAFCKRKEMPYYSCCSSSFYYESKISEVKCIEIPNTIKFIGKHAFDNASKLSAVFIPRHVYVDSAAFANCSNLTIYTEYPENGIGTWAEDWNPDNRPVVWNSTLVDPSNYLYIAAPQPESSIDTNQVVLMQYDSNE